jgi:hypothetical protein
VGFAGCDPAAPTPAAPRPSAHGGILFTIPGDKGTVELVHDTTATKKATADPLVLYFLKMDGQTPLDPQPSAVSVTPEGGKTQPLTLKGDHFETSGADKLGSRNFAGTIKATIGGETVQIDVTSR